MKTRLILLLAMLTLSATPGWAIEQRSHDPSLRELTAELDGLRQVMNAKMDSLRSVIDERDKMYTERAASGRTAIEAALAAAKELSANSSVASKEAVAKSETAQHEYNTRTNEFRGQLDDQAKRLIPRSEVEVTIKNIEDKIQRIESDVRINRENINTSMGKGQGMSQFWDYLVVVIGLVVSVFGALYAMSRLQHRKVG